MTIDELFQCKEYASAENLRDKQISSPYTLINQEMDFKVDNKMEWVPFYYIYGKQFEKRETDRKVLLSKPYTTLSPFSTKIFPIKYLSSFLQNSYRSIYNMNIDSCGEFEIGKYYIKNKGSGKILFLGVVNKNVININFSSSTIEVKKDSLKIELNLRKYPIRFYVDNELLFNPTYKKLYDQILLLISKISKDERYRIIISNNIKGEFFKGFSFPKFKTIQETEAFVLKALSLTVKTYESELK